jgi:uncharacterized membrane protein
MVSSLPAPPASLYDLRVFRPRAGQSARPGRLGMIEHFAPERTADEARLVIRPNLSLSLRQLIAVFAVLALTTFSVAGLSWLQGNAFAPLFAVLYLSLLASCLVLVRRRGRRAEVIAVQSDRVSVRQLPEWTETFADHPGWVRVVEDEGQVWLASGRRRIEVGSCLGAGERRQMARMLRDMLGGSPPHMDGDRA